MPSIFTKRHSWAWLVCLILLSGFLLTSISSYHVTRGNMRETIVNSTLPLTSDNVYSEIQRDLLSPVFIASLMANDTFVRDWAMGGERDEDAITRYLNEIKIKYSTVTSFFVSDKTHKYYHAHGLLKEVKKSDPRDAWYFRARQLMEPYEINVDPDAANSDEMTIFINYRTCDYEGNLLGVTGVGLTVNSVNNLISRYEAKFERQIYFANQDGKIVLRPANSPLLQYPDLNSIEGLSSQQADQLLSNKRSKLSYRRDGETRLVDCRYVPELDWYLIVEQGESTMLAPIREQLIFNILLAIAITSVVAYICIAAINRHQAKIHRRNDELIAINQENETHKQELLQAAQELETANRSLSQLNSEKDEFLSIVAHDLRSPLNAIIGFCDMAEEEDEDEAFDIGPFVSDIKDSGERMLELTQKLLEVSRIEAFQGTVETEEVDWNSVIEVSAGHFARQAEDKKIHIQLELEATTGIVTQSRADWLQICMGNLISNAIKYMPRYGQLCIKTRLFDDSIKIHVSDSGPGISKEDQKKMFGKFVRLSAKPTANEPSTGLGLYIVKKMCERLGLEIQVCSELGSGTTFTVIQPLDRNE